MLSRGKEYLETKINGVSRVVRYRPVNSQDCSDVSQLQVNIRPTDLVSVLTINNSDYNNNMRNIIGKISILNKELNVSFLELSRRLNFINIDKIHIFSINLSDEIEIEPFKIKELPNVTYIEIGVLKFIEFLSGEDKTFFD
jgi:hypothetical protein